MSDTDALVPELTDPELISRVREGDVGAYGTLFSRHLDAATRLARLLVGGPDADDLVSEAFVKVLNVLLGGGGPDVAFRAYLLTAVRRLHVDKVRSQQKLTTTGDMTPFDPGVPFTDTAVAGFEGGAAAKAFASLPERWQMVLWHLEVENQRPADIAPLLGMSANSVSALAYRAREGLRQAFLNMHSGDLVSDACRDTNDLLGGYVRHALSRRDTARVEDHLDHCRRCTAVYLELAEVNSSLAGLLGPVLLGGAAAAYLGGGAAVGAAAGAGAGVGAVVGRVRDLATAHLPATAAAAVTAVGVATIAGIAITNRGPAETPAAAEPPNVLAIAPSRIPSPTASPSPHSSTLGSRPSAPRSTTAAAPGSGLTALGGSTAADLPGHEHRQPGIRASAVVHAGAPGRRPGRQRPARTGPALRRHQAEAPEAAAHHAVRSRDDPLEPADDSPEAHARASPGPGKPPGPPPRSADVEVHASLGVDLHGHAHVVVVVIGRSGRSDGAAARGHEQRRPALGQGWRVPEVGELLRLHRLGRPDVRLRRAQPVPADADLQRDAARGLERPVSGQQQHLGHAGARGGPPHWLRQRRSGKDVAMTATRLLARPLLASTFIVGGVSALKNAPALAVKAKPVVDRIRPTLEKIAPQVKIPDDTVTLVRINAVAQILGSRRARPGPRPAPVQHPARGLSRAHHRRRPPVLERDGPGCEGQPEDPLLQEPLDARWRDAGGRGHRGPPRCRLADQARRDRRSSRGAPPGQAGQARGQARREVDRPIASGAWRRARENDQTFGSTCGRRRCARGPVDARVDLPGSKSLTNRALVLAALSDRPSRRTPGAAFARHRADGHRAERSGRRRRHRRPTTGR